MFWIFLVLLDIFYLMRELVNLYLLIIHRVGYTTNFRSLNNGKRLMCPYIKVTKNLGIVMKELSNTHWIYQWSFVGSLVEDWFWWYYGPHKNMQRIDHWILQWFLLGWLLDPLPQPTLYLWSIPMIICYTDGHWFFSLLRRYTCESLGF